MPLSGSIRASINLLETLTGDLETASAQINSAFGWDIANGTGANQANLKWSDTRPLGSGANENLDLNTGLSGLTGPTVFAKVKGILVSSAATNTVNVTFSGIPFFPAAYVLKPGGVHLLIDPSAAGIPVVETTADKINVLAGAAAVTYSIVIVGTNA